MARDTRYADARPMAMSDGSSSVALLPGDKVRPRIVAAVVFGAWLTLVTIRKGMSGVMP